MTDINSIVTKIGPAHAGFSEIFNSYGAVGAVTLQLYIT